MKKISDADKAALNRFLQKASEQDVGEMRRLNENVVKVVELLNRDVQISGVNQYETLRRIVRDDEKMKEAYRGIVNPSKAVMDALQVFAKRASSEAGVAGGTRLDDVLRENAPQKVFDEIVKDILPDVISSHVQDYMANDRTQLR